MNYILHEDLKIEKEQVIRNKKVEDANDRKKVEHEG